MRRCLRRRAIEAGAQSGLIHDLTPVRQAGLVELLALIGEITLLADAGY